MMINFDSYLLIAALITFIICLLLGFEHLLILSIISMLIADTNLLPRQYIYMARFIPIGTLFIKVVFITLGGGGIFISRYLKMWLPFCLLALFSSVYSLTQVVTLERAISGLFVIVGVGLGIPLYLKDRKSLLNVLNGLGLLMAFIVLYSFYLIIVQKGYMAHTDRLKGVFKNPNTLGLIAMQFEFILIYLILIQKEYYKYNLLIAIAVGNLVILILSGCRAATLGLLVGFIAVFISMRKANILGNSKILNLGGYFLVVLVLILSFYPQTIGDILRTETASRTVLWDRSFELSQLSPYWGVGFGGSDLVYNRDIIYLKSMKIFYSGSHSSYMRLLVDLGYIGVIMFIVPLIYLINASWKKIPFMKDKKLGCCLLGFTIASLVDAGFESWLLGFGSSSTIPFWFIFGLLCIKAEEAR
jgi:O-antigen ligase